MDFVKNLKINLANRSDLIDVFNLANDSVTRKNSLNSNSINFEDHVKWFENKVSSHNSIFYVARNLNDEFIGYVRFDKNTDNIFVISISISEPFRGKGLGSYLINEASRLVIKNKNINKIYAYIKKENEASYRSFLKSGYKLLNEEFVKNILCFKLGFTKE